MYYSMSSTSTFSTIFKYAFVCVELTDIWCLDMTYGNIVLAPHQHYEVWYKNPQIKKGKKS